MLPQGLEECPWALCRAAVLSPPLPPPPLSPPPRLQLQLDEAEWLMNRAAAGEASWEEIRDPLAQAYSRAGLNDVARFIVS